MALSSLSPSLMPGHTYKARVCAKVYITWGNFSDECKLTIGNIISSRMGSFDDESTESENIEESINNQSDLLPNFDLMVYPNPMDEEANIMVTSSEKMQVNIRMYDITGKLVFEKNISSNSNVQINQLQLDKGIYLVTAASRSGEKKTIKLIKK